LLLLRKGTIVLVTAAPKPLLLCTTGDEVTAKFTPLPAFPPTVTTTFPVLAPLGTRTTMLLLLQLMGAASAPLNVTVLVPLLAPNAVPLRVTAVPTGPDVGDRLCTAGDTVNATALLAFPPTVATKFPVAAPAGTGTTICVVAQLVGVATVPLNVIVLVPWLLPNPPPLIVTDLPTGALDCERLVMEGSTVNGTPLLPVPPTNTTTLPVMAALGTGATICVELQLVGVAGVAPKKIKLFPCELPKFVPVIVTEAPIGPKAGERPETLGVCACVVATATRKKIKKDSHFREFPIEPFGLPCNILLPLVPSKSVGAAMFRLETRTT
jgi:hypothetical protein